MSAHLHIDTSEVRGQPIARLEPGGAPEVLGSSMVGSRYALVIRTADGLLAVNGSRAEVRGLLDALESAFGRADAEAAEYEATHCGHAGCYDTDGHTDGCLRPGAGE